MLQDSKIIIINIPHKAIVNAIAADQKIAVLKEVRVITNLGLKEAKEFVETLPKTIKSGISKTEAEKIKTQLEEAGASISIH